MAKKKAKKKIRYSTAPTYQLNSVTDTTFTTSSSKGGKTLWRKGSG